MKKTEFEPSSLKFLVQIYSLCILFYYENLYFISFKIDWEINLCDSLVTIYINNQIPVKPYPLMLENLQSNYINPEERAIPQILFTKNGKSRQFNWWENENFHGQLSVYSVLSS